MKTYMMFGGNGPFGVHNALYLLEHANPPKVICVVRGHKRFT